jgi:hypothetical protein
MVRQKAQLTKVLKTRRLVLHGKRYIRRWLSGNRERGQGLDTNAAILSCLFILPCPVSCLVLSGLLFSCLLLPCLVSFCFILSCHVLSCLVFVLSSLVLFKFVSFCFTLFFLFVFSCLVLPSCLSCLVRLYLTISKIVTAKQKR